MPPLSFTIQSERFDLGLLPPEARVRGTPEYRTAITAFLESQFQDFGGHATFKIDETTISVAWDPENRQPDPLGMIVAKLHRGHRQEAIQLLVLLLSHKPDDVNVLYNLGMALSDAGSLADAEKHLRRAVDLAPGFTNALVALGVALSRAGKNAEAIGYLKTATTSEPGNGWAQLNLGVTLMKAGDFQNAREHLQKAAAINPEYQMAWLALGDACQKLGQKTEAKAAYDRCVEINPRSDIAELAKRGSNKLAEQTFQGVLKDMPRPDAVQYCLAALQMFSKMSREEVKNLALEISLAGQNGLDLASPETQYRVKSLDGSVTGLQLVSFLYVAMQQIAPGESMGFDLAREYQQALTLFAK